MGLLADWQIRQLVKIEPFADEALRPGVISYGVSSYGYDVRVGRKFKMFTNVYGAVIDPKRFDPTAFVDIEADHCVIPPNSFALAETVEYFEIPRDVLGICLGKSTYARLPPAKSDHQRPGARRRGSRGVRQERVAHHGGLCAGAGA